MRSGREVSFVSGVHRIDARLHEPDGEVRGGFVVAHPHPAHRGDMDHPAVIAAADRAAAHGLLAMRFDFGGVRGSEGDVDDFEAHLEDWRQAIRDMDRRTGGKPLWAGGFSYGARSLAWLLNPRVDRRPAPRGVLLLAPATRVPRTKRDFGNLLLGRPITDAAKDEEVLANLRGLPVPARVLVGEFDVVAPPDELRENLPPGAHLEVLPRLNHFFSERRGAGSLAEDVFLPALDDAFRALLPDRTP